MIKIVSLILQLGFVAGGVYLGLTLKSPASSEGQETESHDDGAHKDDSHEKDGHKKPDKKKKKKKKDSHGKDSHGGSEGDGSTYGYLKFSRQFIVPIVNDAGVNSLVILDINLEVTPSATEKAYSQEPRLRDAVLSALLTLSNEGAFDEKLLEEDNMENIRDALLSAARSIIGDDALEVLILSIARQNF